MQLLSDLIEKPAVHEKMQSALAQWHAPHAAEQIAEAMLLAVGARAGEGCHADPRAAALPGSRTADTRDNPKASGPPQAGRLQISDANRLPGRRCRQGGALEPAGSILEKAVCGGGEAAEELAQRVSRATVIRRDEPLAKHTTLRVGGPADIYVEPASEQDLAAVLAYCRERGRPFFVLGRGSNLLVKDGGFRGVGHLSGARAFQPDRGDGRAP